MLTDTKFLVLCLRYFFHIYVIVDKLGHLRYKSSFKNKQWILEKFLISQRNIKDENCWDMTLELFWELAESVLNWVLQSARQLCFSVHFLHSHCRNRSALNGISPFLLHALIFFHSSYFPEIHFNITATPWVSWVQVFSEVKSLNLDFVNKSL